MEFNELNLHPDLQRGIVEAGYTACMPVQEQVLTNAFGGQDLYVQSQTGTGKTAAFLIVIFQRLLSEPLLNGKKAIIMVPTRELAVQVEEEAKVLGRYLPFRIGSFYGGVGYAQQTAMLRDNVQILVGTPGRVLDLNQSGQMNLMDIAFLVLDEADRMFDMGFYPDLRKLIKVVPPADRRQTMLFSATLNAWVKNLAWEYTKTPYEIEIEPETVTVDEVEQILYHVPSTDKMRLLMGIMQREQPESALIFCNTKRYAEIVAKRMRMNGYEAEFIIGDLPQVKRLKIIDDIKAGNIRFLVATDVAARGLDIEGLALVVNYDLPNEAENYVHRIGRTARAGKTGKAISMASEQDVYELPSIEKYIGKKIPCETTVEEIYAEDKSAGAKIHTDFYEERGGGRDSGRRDGSRRDGGRRDDRSPRRQESGAREGGGFREGGSSSRKRDRDGRRREGERGPRDGGLRPGEGPGGGQGPERGGSARRRKGSGLKSGGRQEGRRDGMDRESGGEGRGAGNGADLSRLSFEERMAYYKQKYDTPESGASAGDRGRGPKDGEGRQGGREGGGRRRGGRGRRGGRDSGRQGEKAGGQSTPQKPGSGSVAAGEKKSLLSKIFGVFKKKGGERT